jgi:putative membrane protein insertion efficiency factor
MKSLLLLLIRGYQYLLRPMLGSNCRFYPSCSDYAREAVQAHGAARGSWLAARRVCRCHPYHPGGYDPVPPPADKGARDLARDMHRS